MRILLVHQFLWSHYKAGIFKELENLFQDKDENALHIIQTAKYEKSRLDFGKADTSIHNYNYELLFDDIYENTGFFNRIKKVLYRIRKFKPDILVLPGYYEPAMICLHMIAKSIGIKVILSIDSTESDNPNKWYAELIKKGIIFLSDGFFCYGSKSADYMKKLGSSEEKILLRKNSVNNELVADLNHSFKKTEEYKLEKKKIPKYNFIFVGRFLDIKNIITLLEAFKLLSNAKDWGLLLVGDGPLKKEIVNYQLNIKNIYIYPPQEWKGVPKKLALADVLVLPSYSEPWGLVTNEAMVCGMPVIVSNQAGSSADLVQQNVNGFSFDAFDKIELMNAMQFFIDNPNELITFGLQSKEIIKGFSPEKVALGMFNGFKKTFAK